MSVSATQRPPYGPKWPSASGRFGAADEFLDLPMVLSSGAALDAGRDVDAVRTKPADDVADGLRAEPARDDEPACIDSRDGVRVDRDARSAGDAGHPRVDEHVI